ncbi:universal stress protein [Roseivirga echinicomitans]|uniref:UspA domain-containing protein n=1 Tax=Roseivirga echinicomitans TaxID=296218 RepID=A0A150XUQ9_9BACT|nr:universal stress protein [Roseivirga echinicomitans]KYG82470.1 hypothetical protein AWN68_14545 [Roseivirga echinicomitans]
MRLKTILVPIDFSGCSVKALRFAIGLAEKTEAKLVIMNACQKPAAYTDANIAAYSKKLIREAELNAIEAFEIIKAAVQGLDDVTHEFRVKHAFPQDAIISATLTENIDLIVMGTIGASGIKGILMGSNTYTVIKNVTCPVLAIPIEASENIEFKKIVLAGDYQQTNSKETYQSLVQIAKVFKAEVHILHVSESTLIKDSEVVEAEKLDGYFKGLKHSFHYIIDKHIDAGLQEYIGQNDIDLLAIVAKSHNLIELIFKGSVTKKMAYHSKTPLLVLHQT